MLYICATPIGNLSDITVRALDILANADIVLCEDTRVSGMLLKHHGIFVKKLVALHEHNESTVTDQVIKWLQMNLTICQITDAGTPGISDPGARMCHRVIELGLPVSPLPGACAFTALLSVSGINGISSMFYGFLPNKSVARKKVISSWLDIDYAVCIYEAPHRIVDCLTDICDELGSERVLLMGRELTKQFETIKKMMVFDLLNFVSGDLNQQRGEFAILIYPNIRMKNKDNILTPKQIEVLQILLLELPPKKAVKIASKLVGGDLKLMYEYAITSKT